MVNLLWRTDVHVSDVTPRGRKDNWTEMVLNKLTQVGQIAFNISADAVIDGGDFFHIKVPTRNSHALVQRVMELHRSYPCPVYCTPGNHDSVYGDYSFLYQQPLGVLYSSGIFNRLYDEYEAIFVKDGIKVRVVGVPYHGAKYDLDRLAKIRKKDEDFLVVVAHLLASKDGGSMFEGEDILRYSDLVQYEGDIFCFGHWHKDQGVTEISPGRFVVATGSLTRGSLSQDEISRVPKVVQMGFDKLTGIMIKEIPLQIGDPMEVFDLEARVRIETRNDMVENFVQGIKTTLQMQSDKTLVEIIRDLSDTDSSIKEKALFYLERIG
jgi:DNA repair exonuclease SbcCD nuclease subunit